MSFNCGKMQHIFKTSGAGDEAINYIPEWSSEDAEKAMILLSQNSSEIKVYRKIDGSCGAIIKEGDEWSIFQRYDAKKNKEIPATCIRPPVGDCVLESQDHNYFLRKIERSRFLKGKGEKKISDSLYNFLDNVISESKLEKDFYTIELVGPNFNRTPGVETNSFILHTQQLVTNLDFSYCKSFQDWFAALTNYFRENPDEGFIIQHGSKFWKIHAYKFIPSFAKERPYRFPNMI